MTKKSILKKFTECFLWIFCGIGLVPIVLFILWNILKYIFKYVFQFIGFIFEFLYNNIFNKISLFIDTLRNNGQETYANIIIFVIIIFTCSIMISLIYCFTKDNNNG